MTEATINAIVEQMRGHPGVTFHLDAQAAFTLAGALQLACRHPVLDDLVRDLLVEVVEHIAEGLGGPIAAALEAGWDPANDR
jgi:hypothetical protein